MHFFGWRAWGAALVALSACTAFTTLCDAASVEPLLSWPLKTADLAPDPTLRFGALPNGMRYVIRPNPSPSGAVTMMLRMAVGSMYERDDQQGLAHFVEHMAFRGSTRVPDGDMETSLERLGLKLGNDINAFTDVTHTVYMLNLPHNDSDTLDRATMLLREIASELILAPASVDAERPVVLSELRLRDSSATRMDQASNAFYWQGQRPGERPVGGKPEVIEHASAAALTEFYRTWYRPERATIVVVGDVAPEMIEEQIRQRFKSWSNAYPGSQEPSVGIPVPRGASSRVFAAAGATRSVAIYWVRALDANADSVQRRRREIIADIGFSVLANWLRDAILAATSNVLSSGSGPLRQPGGIMEGIGGEYRGNDWKGALEVLETYRRQAVERDVTQADVDRAVHEALSRAQLDSTSANTQPSPAVAFEMMSRIEQGKILTSPAEDALMLAATAKDLKAEAVSAELRRAFKGSGPLVFLTGPEDFRVSESEVLKALAAIDQAALPAPRVAENVLWPYAHFGPPGTVVGRHYVDDLDLTLVRFANGVQLNVKPTKLTAGEASIVVRVGTGRLALPKDRPTAMWLVAGGALIDGGLGKIDAPSISRVLAGKQVINRFKLDDDAFLLEGAAQTADVELELQLMTAYLTDAAWRPSALDNANANYMSRVSEASSNAAGVFARIKDNLLHSGDLRWVLPTAEEAKRADVGEARELLTYAFRNGPIEITVVGDVIVDQAIALVAKTLGALPARHGTWVASKPGEVAFPTATRDPLRVSYRGDGGQDLAIAAWPTTDSRSSDPADIKAAAARELLAQTLMQRLYQAMRVLAGDSYQVYAEAQGSGVFIGYGYILSLADVPAKKADVFFDELAKITADLRNHPMSPDEFERIHAPAVQQLIQLRQTNGFWLQVLYTAQSDPSALGALRGALPALKSVSTPDIQAAAQRYLLDKTMWKLAVEKGR